MKKKMKKKWSLHKKKSKRKILKVLKQTGKSNKSKDQKRKALLPGKRISKSGNRYTETRKNRSDKKGRRT